jgi:hypothetical protein
LGIDGGDFDRIREYFIDMNDYYFERDTTAT